MTDLVRVDLDAFRVWKGNQQINLAASDMRILALLIRRAGRAVTHEQAFREAWGDDRCVSTVAVNHCVFRIRAQLGDGYIETIRTVGYRFAAETVVPAETVAPADPEPLAAYVVAVVGGRLALPCPHDGCRVDLLATDTGPGGLNRMRELAAWHELDHWAEAS